MGWQGGGAIDYADCWLESDLHKHDNTAFTKAAKHRPVLPL